MERKSTRCGGGGRVGGGGGDGEIGANKGCSRSEEDNIKDNADKSDNRREIGNQKHQELKILAITINRSSY